MITTQNIIKAINRKLKEEFPDIKIWSTDKDKDFGSKCFFVKYTVKKDGSPEFIHEQGEVRIYYFPSARKARQAHGPAGTAFAAVPFSHFCNRWIRASNYRGGIRNG